MARRSHFAYFVWSVKPSGMYKRGCKCDGNQRENKDGDIKSPLHGSRNSVRHGADFFFDFGDIHHDDGVPRAAIQEAAVGAFAEALLAADTLDGVNLDAPERRIVLVRHPEHAVFHPAVLDAGGPSRPTGAALRNDGQFFRFFLARGGDSLRARFKLLLVGHHSWSFH